jgi:hypothetical protein
MKLMLKIAGGVILASVVLTAGCAALVGTAANEASKEINKEQAWSLQVSAPHDACWSGAVGSVTEDGCGSKTIDFKDMAITAAVMQKQTDGSWTLRASLIRDGKTLDAKQTSAEFGIVTVDGADF